MSARNALLRDQSGATVVEFALTLPIFIALVFGVIQVGMLLWTKLGMQNAVETAARCASVNTTLCPDAATIQSYAAQNAFGLNLPSSTFVSTAGACGQQVSATYSYPIFSPYFPASSVTLTAQSCAPT